MKVQLKTYFPPQDSAHAVVLTREQRNSIGRYKLARFVRSRFNIGTKISIKDDGAYTKITRPSQGVFRVDIIDVRLKRARHGFSVIYRSYAQFVEFLINRFHDTTQMLKIVKLIDKNALDHYSLRRAKQSRAVRCLPPPAPDYYLEQDQEFAKELRLHARSRQAAIDVNW